ncbi:4,5-DOPA dioxygenase extradiol [Pedobacter westerhofensis]|uniref:4,5-DOPA dioxygenase extradiol n=1 Tax=Pedobacter westerhofensis TaxID=425512 RepID=A0A521DW34_9SPHI|nr:4,5-DOPA dioxygenase extradiol [Pedobacter westerhofensis]SMO75949.1 4,5-DOPA dioxygenase extradiol [Pedobacter westerhofensis]
MANLSQLRNLTDNLPIGDELMPVLFIGHGSPMNGIEDNEFSSKWADIGRTMPVPKAVLVVSAHWFTRGTAVTAMNFPKTIHDFGGFPQALFDAEYPAPGSPELARELSGLVTSTTVELDHDWGLDHGAWTVLAHMFPEANIPVLQLSMDYTKDPKAHYELARELYQLRRKGVLIMGSGNMVHNLRMLSWEMMNGGGYDWAMEINDQFKNLIMNRNHRPLMDYKRLGSAAMLAIPTPEHYLPLLYTLGLQNDMDEVSLFNDKAVGGSLTMTSVRIG